jgi:putative ABC transport system permease protein
MSWSRFFRRRRWDQERSREIEAYLQIETDENVARGMVPEDALLVARKKLGNRTLIREEIYQMNTIRFVETLWQDLRHGARLLRLNLGFAIVAIASLALGIGANAAIFQLLDAVRMRTLPVKNPEQLAGVRIRDPKGMRGSFGSEYPAFTNPLWEGIRDHQQAFSSAFAWAADTFNIAPSGEARYARGLMVSGQFFEALGVPAILGRTLGPADDQRGCGSPGVVLSYGFWQSEFGGNAGTVGRKLTIEGHPYEIVGITPASFFGLDVGRSFDLAVPLCSERLMNEQSLLDLGSDWWLTVMGRLKPGWSTSQADASLTSISAGVFESTLPAKYPPENIKDYLGYKLATFPAGTGVSGLREQYSNPLWLLLAGWYC